MKRNDGKTLEKVVRLIHETLKDSLNTTVHPNHTLKDLTGDVNEIDVLIEAEVNKEKLLIAIECKSYGRSIEREKIDAFNSKCSRTPSINKKKFIAENGYQSGALNAAKLFGIDLQDLKTLAKDSIAAWVGSFGRVEVDIKLKGCDFLFLFLSEDDYKMLVRHKPSSFNLNETTKADLSEYLVRQVEIYRRQIYGDMFEAALKDILNETETRTFPAKIGWSFKEPLPYVALEGKRLLIKGLESAVEITLRWLSVPITDAKVLISNQVAKAKYASAEFEDGKAEVVITDETEKFFHTNSSGEPLDMHVRFAYDPSTQQYFKGGIPPNGRDCF